MHILYGIALLAIGISVVLKSEAIFNALGRVGFFEQYLGTEGGSRLGYKLIGLLITFIGVLFLTGMIDGFMVWLISPLARGRF
jgi:hypothetical protein